ncbi:MAG: hypothetical protein ABI840_05195 [bacterium]
MKKILRVNLLFSFLFFILTYKGLFSQLSGIYTIGTGGNYITISSAIAALATNGVSGPVRFDIASGTYDDPVTIDSITGSSSINTITFQSQSGNPDDVLWINSNESPNYVLQINGADNLILKYITIKHTYPSFLSNTYNIFVNGNTENNMIMYNKITGGAGLYAYGIYGNNAVMKNFIVKGNSFDNYYCVRLDAVSERSSGTQFLENSFFGIDVLNINNNDSMSIEKNQINSRIGFNLEGSRCIFLNSCNSSLRILKNKIVAESFLRQVPSICLLIQNCTGFNALIANNFFNSSYGNTVRILNSNGQNLYFNSMYTNTLSSTNFSINSSSLNFKNNLLMCLNPDMMFQSRPLNLNSSLINSDYNNFYYLSPTIAIYNGANINDIIQLRLVTGNDYNSVVREVFTVSSTDLHLTGTSIGDTNLIGTPIPEVTDDYDGNLRDTLHPTMGADEPVYAINIGIDVTLLIEGFYDNFTNAQVPDTVKAYLRSVSSPYSIVDSAIANIKSNGTGKLRFYNAPSGTYYIEINHRNSIETWSKPGGESLTRGNVSSYDFTNSISQAFGNNLKLKGNKYCIFSGDVNQDRVIDISDNSLIDNDAFNFVSGYVSSDLTGDNFVDLADYSIADNNAFNFVSVIRP